MLCFDLSTTFARIRVRGTSRADFLHRMSTGDLVHIKPGETRSTVFTTPIGRMVDVATITAFDDSLLMLSSYEYREKLLRWLRKYVFFNDDVQFSDESQTLTHFGVFGDGAIAAAQTFANEGLLIPAAMPDSTGWHVVGAAGPIPNAPIAQYDDLRIAAGQAHTPNEVSEDYIPLEAGLWDAVSFNKGCYIGQEIIARMESRGQLAKKLMRLQPQPGATVGDLLCNGENAGKLTSISHDGLLALGYVRSAFANPGQALTTATGIIVTVIPAA